MSKLTNSLTSTLPPLNTKHPLRLMSVTVAVSRESTPSQRAGRFTLTRGAARLAFISLWSLFSHSHPALAGCSRARERGNRFNGFSVRERAAAAAVFDIEIGACFPDLREEFLIER